MLKDIEEYILNSNTKIIGVVGGAGAGKTTLATSLTHNIDASRYSADHRFIGDSNFRKMLLEKKRQISTEAYIDACNQYNWWDWASIENDLKLLKENKTVSIDKPYNRELGLSQPQSLLLIPKSKIIYEGALLGSPQILNTIDKIIFIHTDKLKRLTRLIEKDSKRRSVNEIVARFLITEYSENKHYQYLFKFHRDKIVVVNDNYTFISLNENIFNENQYIPLPIIN